MTFMHSLRRLSAAVLVAGTMALAGTGMAHAQQEISPEHLSVARQYIDMTDGANIYELTLIDLSVSVMRILIQQDPALADPLPGVIEDVFEEYLEDKDALFNQFARIYAMRFTQEELEEILAFYRSDLGQKLLEENVSINQDMQLVLGVWERNTQSEFLSRVRAVLREGGYSV